MLKRVSAFILSAVVIAGCSESTAPTQSTNVTPVQQGPRAGGERILAELRCSVDASSQSIDCGAPAPSLARGALGDIILGGQNTYVTLASTNVSTVGTTLSADVTVKNLTVQPWGTTDGSTAAPNGVRVFFNTGPTNGVTVANPTGTQTYTNTNQPYFEYSGTTDLGADGILTTGETSAAKTWQFDVTASPTFTFTVYVVTTMPDEPGVLKWSPATLSQTASAENINAVWGSSSSDVWVGGTAGNTSLHHWDGASWTASAGAETSDIAGLWGTSSSDIYAVGGTKIQHYNGSSWSDVSSGATSSLLAVWGSSATDIYAGGMNGTLVHSTGGSFTAVSSTGLGTNYVAAIWGSSASDVYVAGAVVRHWNGSTWSAVSAGITNAQAIWGSSASDVWIGGVSGALVHYNGSSWSTVSGLGSADISGIWGTSSSSVYVVNRSGEIWHYNGSSWVKYTVPSAILLAVWGSGPQDVWAVGTDALFTENGVAHGTH